MRFNFEIRDKIRILPNLKWLPTLGALTLMSAWTPLTGNSQNLVSNGSFEVPGSPDDRYTVGFGSTTIPTNYVAGWLLGPSGVASTPAQSPSGNDYDGICGGNGFTEGVYEGGTNCIFLQGGMAATTVSLNAGFYSLSFWTMARNSTGGNGGNPVWTTLQNGGGIIFSNTAAPLNASEGSLSDWSQTVFDFAVANSGQYSLVFQSAVPYGSGHDYMTFIDNVSILPLASLPPPKIISEPSPQQVLYVGQCAQFTVQTTSAPPISYQWQAETNGIYVNLINGGRISGATSATMIISNLNVGDSTNYQVRLSNAGGTTNSTIAALTVLPVPAPGSPRNTVTVINPSFEDSQMTNDTYTAGYGTLSPSTGVPGWQFSASGGDSYSGIATESGTILGSPKDIPDCWQAAFVQGTGQISQPVTFKAAGTYVVRFRAEGRSLGGAGAEPIAVSVDGLVVGTFTPLTTQWSLYATIPFSVAAGVHLVALTGTVPFTVSDRTSFIDAVEIVSPAEAAEVVPATSPVWDMVFVGDSITYGATLANPATQASAVRCWQSLGTRFNLAMRMSNQGHSGATTLDWLPSSPYNTGYFQGAVAAAAALETNQPGQLVFSIMLGANDSAQSGTDGCPVSPASYRQNLQLIINQFLAIYPNALVFVHYPTWYSTNTHNGALYGPAGAALLESYLPQIDLLVASNAVLYPAHVFAGDKLAYGYFETNYLTLLTPESGVDGTFYLHPNAAGTVVLGGFWANAIAAPLNVSSNDAYVAWLQSRDLAPGAPGTQFGDTPTNSPVSNGVAYGDPDGLSASLVNNSLVVSADIRNDNNLGFVLQESNDLINWSPLAWAMAPSQSGVADGFVRYAIQISIASLQQGKFYRLVLEY